MENFTNDYQGPEPVAPDENTPTSYPVQSEVNLFGSPSLQNVGSSENLDFLSAEEDFPTSGDEDLPNQASASVNTHVDASEFESQTEMDFLSHDVENVPLPADAGEEARPVDLPTQHISQQQELGYLNDDGPGISSDSNPIISMVEEEAVEEEAFTRIQNVQNSLKNSTEDETLLSVFDPQSLNDIQNIGISIHQLLQDGSLKLLSNFISVKAVVHPKGIDQDLVLLIEAHLYPSGLICLKPLPFIKNIPNIPLSERQLRAVQVGKPFFMIKRVIDSLDSEAYEIKRHVLINDVFPQGNLEQTAFEKLLETIRERPLEVEDLIDVISEDEEQNDFICQVVNSLFPLHLTLFTGISYVFIPLSLLNEIPRLQKAYSKVLAAG